MFLERLSADGIPELEYYEPKGKFNTSPAWSENQMPNCTMYCYCRGYEAMSSKSPIPYWVRQSSGFGHAKTWYATTTLPKGSELRTGSVAVFDGNYGHVAFVERKIDATHALISESNYDDNKSLRNWKYWRKREVELVVGKATLAGVGKLIGFIYLPINDLRTAKNTNKDQVSIIEDFVNVRVKANGDKKLGLYCPIGTYNILELKDSGNYKWAKLDTDCWVAVYDIKNNKEVSWASLKLKDTQQDNDEVIKLREENKSLLSKLDLVKDKLKNIIDNL